MAAGPNVLRDLVVVLPGILGSTLARDGRPVWAPSAGAAIRAIKTLGGSIRELTLPKEIGDEHPGDGVEPLSLMPDLHVLPGVWSWNLGYDTLLDGLRSRFHLVEALPRGPDRSPNFLPIAYDWRLSNRYNGRRLKSIVEPALDRWRSQGEPFADAKLIFICHSMGGLVARWYIEKEGGAEVTRKLITIGTPHRGALKALDQLVNGIRKGIGPLRLDLTDFGRSLPALYQLLPEYACIESGGDLRKTTEVELPYLDAALAADAMMFHDELDGAAAARAPNSYDLHPIVGFRQPTHTTARLVDDRVVTVETISDREEGGDATVPRLAAAPKALRPDSPSLRWVPEQHGSLPSNAAVLDELEGVLTARPVVYRAGERTELGLRVPELLVAGEPLSIEVEVAGGRQIALVAEVRDEQGRTVTAALLRRDRNAQRGTIEALPPGAYEVTVGGAGALAPTVQPVTASTLIWPPEAA